MGSVKWDLWILLSVQQNLIIEKKLRTVTKKQIRKFDKKSINKLEEATSTTKDEIKESLLSDVIIQDSEVELQNIITDELKARLG